MDGQEVVVRLNARDSFDELAHLAIIGGPVVDGAERGGEAARLDVVILAIWL
jgi:hypothetical protein